MKLVWDKPTKSFRLLGFLSLSFPFSLSLSFSFSSSSYILYRFPSFFLLQSAPSYWILFPLLPSSYSSISTFLQIFFFFFSRILTGERKRGKGRKERSDTFSLRRVRFVFHTQFYPLAKWSFFSPLCSSPTYPPPIYLTGFPIRLVSGAFSREGKFVRPISLFSFFFFFFSFFFFTPFWSLDPGPLTLFWYLSFVCIEVYVPSCRLARLTCKCNH